MQALDDPRWRLLLSLREAESGLTEPQLELRVDEPVGTLLYRAMTEGFVTRDAAGRYQIAPERRALLDEEISAGLREGAAAGRFYFAFGSNMDPYQMFAGPEARMKGTKYMCRAESPGWFLGFPRRSAKWGGGVAGLLAGRPGATSWGVLFLMRPGDWRILEDYIGVPRAFTQTPIEVRFHRPEAEPLSLRALTYFPVADGSGTRPPAYSYMAHIRAGARAFGLPEDYQEWLEGIRTDPDLERMNTPAVVTAPERDTLGFAVNGYRHHVIEVLRNGEWTLPELRQQVARQVNQPALAHNRLIPIFCASLQAELVTSANPNARGLPIRGWNPGDEGARLTIDPDDYQQAAVRYKPEEGGNVHDR